MRKEDIEWISDRLREMNGHQLRPYGKILIPLYRDTMSDQDVKDQINQLLDNNWLFSRRLGEMPAKKLHTFLWLFGLKRSKQPGNPVFWIMFALVSTVILSLVLVLLSHL